MGASVDARKGHVRLYAVVDRTGKVQAATFYGGVFRVTQRGRVIDLALRGPVPTCGTSTAKKATASAAKKKPKPKKKKKKKHRTRRLWGSGKGSFRTSGHYSAATIRGTKWLVEDGCHRTITRVVHGVVAVRDFRRHKTILVRAGHRYVARRRHS